jgi:hypothetical protein
MALKAVEGARVGLNRQKSQVFTVLAFCRAYSEGLISTCFEKERLK